MAEEENEEVEETVESEGKSPNTLITLFLIVNSIVLMIIAFFQYRSHQRELSRMTVREIVRSQIKEELGKDQLDDEEEGEQSIKDFLLPLEVFTANLAQGDGPRRYVRINIVLKFSNESRPDEFKALKPQIRDSIIGILNSKRPDDLLRKEGKKYLKEEIKSAINFFLIDGHVTDVFYVGFQIN